MMNNHPSKITAVASSSPSTASSSSSYSPSRRRNGLSPRQRRLLQSSARAKTSAIVARHANTATVNNIGAAYTNNGASATAEAGSLYFPSSPPLAAASPSPSSTAASPAESRLITPAELKVPLSPIHHCSTSTTSSPSKPSLCATKIISTGSGSGASTAVLTEATAASIERGIRRRLQLNDANNAVQANISISPAAASASGGIILEEGEVVSKAIRGKVSDRIRALNFQGSLPAQKEGSNRHRVEELGNQSIGNSMIHQEQLSSSINENSRTLRNLKEPRAYAGNQSTGESIEEEAKNYNNHGPLHEHILEEDTMIGNSNKMKIPRADSPIRDIARKIGPYHSPKVAKERTISHPNIANNYRTISPHSKRNQFKLQSPQQQRYPSDEINGDGDWRYYRITFKGVVSLLSELDANAQLISQSEQHHGATTNTIKESGSSGTYYLGYGEIIGTNSPEIIVPMNHSESDRRSIDNVSETRFVRAIRVDSILTGGYAADASSLDGKHHSVAKPMNVQSNSLNLTMNESSMDPNTERHGSHYGYLLLSNHHYSSNQTIAEPLPMEISESLRSSTETGTFLYHVTASSPVPVLSGPSTDAIGLGLGLLPGTVHEVSLRISIPIMPQFDGLGDANDKLADDADTGEIKFLRLGQRRGWVADRRIDAVDQKLRASYLVKDVNDENCRREFLNNHTLAGGPSSLPVVGGLFDDDSFEGDTSSLNSSALNSTVNSSFYSSVVASSVATPSTVKFQRRRNRRRPRGGGMEWSQQPTMALPSLVRENQCRLGGSFEEAGSSITGGGTDVACDVGGDSSSNVAAQIQPTKSYYLMRVIAPLGLKILDSPNFQVSNLIHSPSPTKKNSRICPTTTSPFARTNAMIGSMSAESSPISVGARKRVSPRVRLLARGQIFEASQRMEEGSLYTKGQGLIKLADGSGWAIVPHEEDLIAQFENFHGDELFNIDTIAAFEEIGNCSIDIVENAHPRLTPPKQFQERASERSHRDIIWLRIASPPNGIKVLLPPPQQPTIQQNANKQYSHNTPPKYGGNPAKMNLSTSHDSEIASSVVSNSFLDSVWSRVTPKEKERDHLSIQGRQNIKATISLKQQQPIPVIPCGAVVPVERWDPSATSKKSFARLFNSQGWIPRCLGDLLYAHVVNAPDIRVGSFWFRVKSRSGLDVRHGPSHNASVIKSDNDASFRFECGEFLRASEIIATFNKPELDKGGRIDATECFAKLYRRRNHLNNDDASQALLDRFSSLQSLISPGEWVQVHRNGELFLEECSTAPRIERNRDGFHYMVIRAELNIDCGPSLQANVIGELMREGEELLVSEKVTADGEEADWLRLKSGGWVRSIGNDGHEVMQSIIVPTNGPNNAEHLVRKILKKGSRVG